MVDILTRLMSYVSIQANGCWIWTGCKNEKGYGLITVKGVTKKAHRISFILHKGPIPEGLEPDHICRVRSCINPDHLEPVTHAINVRRGNVSKANKERFAKITHCPRNHEYSPNNTYKDSKGKRRCRLCAYLRNKRVRMEKTND